MQQLTLPSIQALRKGLQCKCWLRASLQQRQVIIRRARQQELGRQRQVSVCVCVWLSITIEKE